MQDSTDFRLTEVGVYSTCCTKKNFKYQMHMSMSVLGIATCPNIAAFLGDFRYYGQPIMTITHWAQETHKTSTSYDMTHYIYSGVQLLKKKGWTKWGTPDTRLYETSIETAIVDHFIQKGNTVLSVPAPLHPCILHVRLISKINCVQV